MDKAPIVLVGSLKGHKALPRRKHVVVEPTPTRHAVKEPVGSRSDQIIYSSAERIKSWIPDPSPIHVVPVVGIPLTTPINFRDDFQSWIDDAALRRREFAKIGASGSSGTKSSVQQSPPTPETTPPRKVHRAQAVASFSSFRNRNLTESRTESFETARENQPSDDEDEPLGSPSLHPSRQKWLRAAGLDTHKDVGLGLGLESEDEEATPGETTPRHPPITQHFAAFDGAWDADMEDSNDYQVLTDPVKPAPFRTGHKRLRLTSEPTLDSPTLGKELGASMKKSLSLRQRVEQSRHSPRNASTEKFAEQINWPLKDNEFDMDTELRDMNTKRLSQVSTTSTVVSAMVINSPPRRRQTLRRTNKMPDLTTPPSNRNSLISNDHSLRRRLRRSGSPEQELRKSFASESPDSLVPSVARSRQDNAPVIPQRRSSLQSSASGSKRLSNTFSLTSRQQSSRPTTAPEDTVGYFDIPRPRDRRTMSVVVHAATPVKCGAKGTEMKPTSIIGDLSPPSVPTSTEEPSTTTSATTAGLDAFYAPATPTTQPDPPHQLTDAQEARTPSIDRLRTGEWSAMRPRSTMVTPFSLRSAHSSTPGTLEVSEATAISIFPHTNKSILVIQQMASGGNASPQERSAIITGEANIALPGPLIYHASPPEPPKEPLNSPLQNPRDPPQPPDLRIIAPTPANGPPSPEKPEYPTRTPSRKNRFSAPVSSLKRTFSARRPRSQSLVAPFTRTFSLRGTAGTPQRRNQIADGPDVKLHPFWRPRAYDDGSDSDSEFGNTGYLNGSRVQSQARGEAPPGRTMSLTRRLSNSIRLSQYVRRQRPSSMIMASDRDYPHESGRPRIWEEDGRKSEVMPSPGYHVQFVGFRGLAHMLEKRRKAKEEDKREERRQRLRAKIGPVEKGSAGEEV